MRTLFCLIALVSVSAAFTASGAAAKAGSHCRNMRTIQQAVQAGEMPAIVAALHGGAPISNPLLNCSK
jgi:hypothetical protein